ncbi:MAG TPA: 23S rRNA (pseudouridine(1915)-N(3))-methyltransferase RlmH [Polyangiaceae bacterium]|nr:23S rRNA (pseudouridine(1915)-N(3))-methyltransferase RlmH [Polyangiaceae bacterium]
MKLFVIAEGRIKEREMRAIANDYLGRLSRYVKCDEIETKDAAGLVKAIPEGAFVVALEVDGERISSSELSTRLERWGARGKGLIAFVIGGAEGIPSALSAKADVRLSLSTFTFPHRLARVMLFEQLYRSMTLLRGEPYARED